MKTFCRIIGFPPAAMIVAGLLSAVLIAPVFAAPPTDPQTIGILVTGSHHQPHHLAIAKGELTHDH